MKSDSGGVSLGMMGAFFVTVHMLVFQGFVFVFEKKFMCLVYFVGVYQ